MAVSKTPSDAPATDTAATTAKTTSSGNTSQMGNTIRRDISSLVERQKRIRNKRKSLGSQFGIHHKQLAQVVAANSASGRRRQSLDSSLMNLASDGQSDVDSENNTIADASQQALAASDAANSTVGSIAGGLANGSSSLNYNSIVDGTDTESIASFTNHSFTAASAMFDENQLPCDDDISLAELKGLIEKFNGHTFLFKRVIEDWESIVYTEINQQPPAPIDEESQGSKEGEKDAYAHINLKQICSHPTTVFEDLHEIRSVLFKTKNKQEFISTFSNEQFLRQIAELPPSFMNQQDLEYLQEECNLVREELWTNKSKLDGQNKQLEEICESLIEGYAELMKQITEAKQLMKKVFGIETKLSGHRKTLEKMEELKTEFEYDNEDPGLKKLKDGEQEDKFDFRPGMKMDKEGEALLGRYAKYNTIKTKSAESEAADENATKTILKEMKRAMSYRDKLRLIHSLRTENGRMGREQSRTERKLEEAKMNRKDTLGALRAATDTRDAVRTRAAKSAASAQRARIVAAESGPNVEALADWYAAAVDAVARAAK